MIEFPSPHPMPVRKLFRYFSAPSPLPASLPQGRRFYAVGDIHGRRDLLDELLARIEDDAAARGPADTLVIFLGDLIDRGPDSRGVVERLMAFRDGPVPSRFLMGNHEEVFLKALKGDLRALRFLIRIGGRETLLSYGATEEELDAMTLGQLREWLMSHIPEAHLRFIEGMAEKVLIGDYAFVHAGVRPRVPMGEQEPRDLRWIREEFLTFPDPHDYFVVHGHSITADVEERPNRVGIDTGAYASGILTAVGLEETARWFLSTAD